MIGVFGISHKTASQDIRAKFALTKDEILAFWDIIHNSTEITEAVILSTCNRIEIYFHQDKSKCERVFMQLKELLSNFKKVEGEIPAGIFYHFKYEKAVKHLFEVNSGVDSMVIGEDQIVNQTKDAYVFCTNNGMTDAVLMRMFQKSFETGKSVRSKTAIQQGATSVSYVGVDQCVQKFGCINNRKALVIGAGETSILAIENLKQKGCTDITITNRTQENAEKVAKEYGCKVIPFSNYNSSLERFDMVFAATRAGNHLVSKSDLTYTVNEQVFIDYSLPRNIEPTIAETSGADLISMDEIQKIVDGTAAMRKDSIANALEIIDAKVEEYFEWLEMRALRPVIKSITTNMQKLRDVEMPNRMGNLDKETIDLIDEHTTNMTQKYIRSIIKNLKDVAQTSNSGLDLKTIDKLFQFDV